MGRLWSLIKRIVRRESGAGWRRGETPEPAESATPSPGVTPLVEPPSSVAAASAAEARQGGSDGDDDAVVAVAAYVAHQHLNGDD